MSAGVLHAGIVAQMYCASQPGLTECNCFRVSESNARGARGYDLAQSSVVRQSLFIRFS